MSDTRKQEPKPIPEEIERAETVLRFRGLADETHIEMWMRHHDERADVHGGGLPTEEMPSQQEARHRAEWAALEKRELVNAEVVGSEAAIGPAQEQGHFLSLKFIGRNIGDHLSRSMEMVLDTFFSFFVSEPKLTAQQAHERLQSAGNVETLHAHAVAADVRENEAAHDWQSVMTINQQQVQDLRLAQTLGTPVTAEANLGYDEHEAARQQQKLSM